MTIEDANPASLIHSPRSFSHYIGLLRHTSDMSAIAPLVKSLTARLEKGIKCDSWGQRLEAAQEYKKFCHELEESPVNLSMDESNEKVLETILLHLRSRSNQLKDAPGVSFSQKSVTLEDIEEDLQTFKNLVNTFQTTLNKRHSSVVVECGENLLLPIPKKIPGHTYLTIKIDKIGLKDAQNYVDPFITVSTKDRYGTDLAPVQHTPPSYHIQGNYIIFQMNVHIPVPMEELNKMTHDFAIFFEFKHYKEKKDKVSTRCFGVVEPDELKPGVGTVELYKKPVDYGRKKLYLFTEKTLYLHLQYTIEKA